jgi:hypothetical protein
VGKGWWEHEIKVDVAAIEFGSVAGRSNRSPAGLLEGTGLERHNILILLVYGTAKTNAPPKKKKKKFRSVVRPADWQSLIFHLATKEKKKRNSRGEGSLMARYP